MTEISAAAPIDAAEINEAVLEPGMTGRLRHLGQQAVLGAAKLSLAAAALSPVAAGAGITAAYLAPEAHVSLPIAGADITAQIEPGSNVVTTNLQAVNINRYSNVQIGSKDLGATVNFHFNNVSITDEKGGFDGKKLNQIYQEFSNLDPQVATIQDAIKTHYLAWGLGGIGLAYGTALAAYGWRRIRQRQLQGYDAEKLQHVLEDRRMPVMVGRSIAVLGSAGLIASGAGIYFAPNHTQHISVDHNLDGSALAGSGVSGPGKPAVDSLIPLATQYIDAKNAFYRTGENNLRQAFVDKYGATSIKLSKGTHVVIFEDDPQGEDGPQALVGDAAQYYNASAIVVGGDITAFGLPIETPVMDTLRAHAKNKPVIMSFGHHDNPKIVEMAKNYGFHPADGTIQTYDGLHFIGVNAPVPILPGELDPLTDPAPLNHQQAQDIIKKACDSKTPVIAEMHDNAIGSEVAQADCPNIPLVLTGRSLSPQDPIAYDNTTEFISGSTGGHSEDSSTQLYGIIRNNATFMAIFLNKDNHPIGADLITLKTKPAAAVTITDLSSVPTSVSSKPVEALGSSHR